MRSNTCVDNDCINEKLKLCVRQLSGSAGEGGEKLWELVKKRCQQQSSYHNKWPRGALWDSITWLEVGFWGYGKWYNEAAMSCTSRQQDNRNSPPVPPKWEEQGGNRGPQFLFFAMGPPSRLIFSATKHRDSREKGLITKRVWWLLKTLPVSLQQFTCFWVSCSSMNG